MKATFQLGVGVLLVGAVVFRAASSQSEGLTGGVIADVDGVRVTIDDGSDRLHFRGTVSSVEYFDAAHLAWPDRSHSRRFGTEFARIEVGDGRCYLVGPSSATSLVVGVYVEADVLPERFREWPEEISEFAEDCLPVGSMRVIDTLK